ncbi:hypothetical protein L3X38_019379 [Prunus dulcis]|uniref:Uncharacterized protein n=1 Tax=Prunus dulcis TaxID=3755 RepID=A0AAD4ZBN1_PRUDU|nr:hypothetical protein L3X38_019379 [Prunus dulcis]
MWPLPQYDSSIGPSRVESPSNAKLASSDLKSELVARHKSNLLITLLVAREKDPKCTFGASRHETHRATEIDLKVKQVCKLLDLHAPQSHKVQYSEDLVFLAFQTLLRPSKAITSGTPSLQSQNGGLSFYYLHSSFVCPGPS